MSINLIGQKNSSYTLSGTVVNGTINLPLIGANIISSSRFGTKTNDSGEFDDVFNKTHINTAETKSNIR